MYEEDSDETRQKTDNDLADEEKSDKFFLTLVFLLIMTLIFFSFCLMCCFFFRSCTNSMNLGLLPDESNAQCTTSHQQRTREIEPEGRTEAEGCSLPNFNQAFVTTETQTQADQIEKSDLVQETTQGNVNNQNVTNINEPFLFSFGNPSKKFPVQGFKNNSLKLATILESKRSNNSSSSGSDVPPEVPKTSPPPSPIEFPTQLTSMSRSNITPTLNSTGNTSNLLDIVEPVSMIDPPAPPCCPSQSLQSEARSCNSGTQLPFQRRFDVHPTSSPSESYRTCSDPNLSLQAQDLKSFLKSPEYYVLGDDTYLSIPLVELSFKTYNLFPPHSETNQSSKLPINICTTATTRFWKTENSPSEEIPQMVNDSQNISEQDILTGVSEMSGDSLVLSIPSTSRSVHGASSLFPLGSTSRLQYYRGHDISTDTMGAGFESFDLRRRYCPQCHLCTLDCECTSSDENENSNKGQE